MSARHQNHSRRHRATSHHTRRLYLLLTRLRHRDAYRIRDDRSGTSLRLSPGRASEIEGQTDLQRHPFVASQLELRCVHALPVAVVSSKCQAEVSMCAHLVIDTETVQKAEAHTEGIVIVSTVTHKASTGIGDCRIQTVGPVSADKVRKVQHGLLLEGIEADGVLLSVVADYRLAPVAGSLRAKTDLRREPLADGRSSPEVGPIGFEGTLGKVHPILELRIEREILHTNGKLPVILEGVGVDTAHRLLFLGLLCEARNRCSQDGRQCQCSQHEANFGFLGSCCSHIYISN